MPDSAETRRQAQPQVLRALIDERLQMQEAARLNIPVAEQEVRDAFNRIEAGNRMRAGGLEEMLHAGRRWRARSSSSSCAPTSPGTS